MSYWVYMMSSANGRALYTGVTNDLQRRVQEHKAGENKGFTKHYNCNNLVYYEKYENVLDAIAREKQIKGWTRQRKEELILTINPDRADLAKE